ncbi:MAG: AAA-like domain-containing protein [Bacteroidales bacterium]|nr:AAA-like domain-containing protein [Bacteroidales bacterium]
MRAFNTTGTCYPQLHYMVDINNRLDDIENKVAKGEYITINRGRQYGKTTTLYHLAKRLSKDYMVFSISFEQMGNTEFATEDTLTYYFLDRLRLKLRTVSNLNDYVKDAITSIVEKYSAQKEINFSLLDEFIPNLCEKSDKPVVLIIDEVDSASNFESFIKLLRLLRDKYLNRMDVPTFQSVILAGVYDVKNLKLKVRPDSDHQYNSPWNIAVPFDEDMALQKNGIEQMLKEYEDDHKTGMNVSEMAQLVWDYSSGYPFFVSRLCQIIDTKHFEWNHNGFLMAEKYLLNEKNTFFDDLAKKLEDFPKMKQLLKDILYNGYEESFNTYYKHIEIAAMFNYIKNVNGKVMIFNRIIETWMYNLFMVEEAIENRLYKEGQIDRSQFIEGNVLKMDKIIEKFAQHFNDIYGDKGDKFCEDEGRRYFMLYIKPIINGTGNYYIEAQTRDLSRTDMIIDYLGTQYIIEMKIWRGNAYNERGEYQLTEYLDYYHVNKGYMLSFNFNKNKVSGVKTLKFGDKEIVEAVV